MKRTGTLVVALGAGLLALLATACGGGDTIVTANSTETTGISVSGEGHAVGVPDIVLLDLGAEFESGSVAEAREGAASAMQQVIDSLRSNGIADRDIQTTQFSIAPQYDYTGRSQVLRGYRVTNVVHAKLRDVEAASRTIDDAAAAGGNAVVVRTIAFSIDDTTELERQAREAAVNDARERAQQLASHAGVDLGPPVSIVESRNNGGVPYPAARTMLQSAADTATPIQAGELEVTISVNITYALK